jgi:hypothetical protein
MHRCTDCVISPPRGWCGSGARLYVLALPSNIGYTDRRTNEHVDDEPARPTPSTTLGRQELQRSHEEIEPTQSPVKRTPLFTYSVGLTARLHTSFFCVRCQDPKTRQPRSSADCWRTRASTCQCAGEAQTSRTDCGVGVYAGPNEADTT